MSTLNSLFHCVIKGREQTKIATAGVGTPINEVGKRLEYEIKPIIGNYVKNYEILYNAFYEVLSNFTGDKDIHFSGKANILKQPELK